MLRKHLLQAAAVLIFGMHILAFQNCSKNGFTDLSSHSSKQESGNGGNYDGKLSYVVEDLQNSCGDGTFVRSRIDRLDRTFKKVKANCQIISEILLDPSLVTLDPTEKFLTYEGEVYTVVRDPALQPFRSDSLWNTSLGSGAMWSQPSDPDTLALETANADFNVGTWSVPFYLAQSQDPTRAVSAANIATEILKLPIGFKFSAPLTSNKTFAVLDPNKRWMYQYTKCRESATGIECDYGVKDDTCGNGLGGFDLARGLIRSWELQQGQINHVLRFALPVTLNHPSQVVWPATADDFEGLFTSQGRIPYGSTVGIPASVNIDSLGLSRGGRILAKALQDYGAIQRDTSGTTGGITFFAEEAAEMRPEVSEIRSDLAKITPVLRILRNQSATNFHGGGTRRQPVLPTLDPLVCQ